MEYQMIYVCLLETEHFRMLYLVDRRFEMEFIHLLAVCSLSCLFFGLNYTCTVTFVLRLSKLSATTYIGSPIMKYSLFGVIALDYWVLVAQSPVAHDH